jgi:hypothetical protein
MRNKLALALLMTALITIPAFTLDITGTPPTFAGGTPQEVQELNEESALTFNKVLDKLRSDVGGINTKPEEFIKAWGDAGIFASHGATQRAYGGYKIIAVTVGSMIGLRFPGSPFSIMDDLDSLAGKLNEEQDKKVGINLQMLNIHIGVNTSKFLLNNLYLGVQFGFMKLDNLIEGFNFDTFSLGMTLNYQLIAPKTLSNGMFVWRGLNMGTGFIYQESKINYDLVLGSYTHGFTTSGGVSGDITIDPTLSIDTKVNTYVVPVELTTAVRLFWFLNIPLGLGFDLGFGKSDVKINANGRINANLNTSAEHLHTDHPGSFSINAGGDMAPSLFNLKLMTGIGLSIGPAVLDVPITFYLDNGYSVGVSLGLVW